MATAHTERLSRRIWGRRPERPYQYWFSADHKPYLIIESLKPRAAAIFKSKVEEVVQRHGRVGSRGALLTDHRGRFIFVSGSADAAFLASIAKFVRARIGDLPSLGGFADAGAAMARLKGPDAIAALDVSTLDVHRDSALWEGLSDPTPAGTADVLHSRFPGQRMWFWLWPAAPEGVQPLLLTSVESDPSLEVINAQAAALAPAASAITGVAVYTRAGMVQFHSRRGDEEHLGVLAAWVRANIDHAGLRRLRDAQFVLTDAGGVVQHVLQDDPIWEGIPSMPEPGGPADTAATLQGLDAEEPFWFFAGTTTDDPILAVLPVADDPDGKTFRARLPFLRASAEQALYGTGHRMPSGRYLFTTRSDIAGWDQVRAGLVSAFPDFEALKNAAVAQLANGAVVGVGGN